MEIRIGVVHSARELSVETDDSADTVSAILENAIANGDALLWLTDTKGRKVAVPIDKIAYVEVAVDAGGRKVGFGAG